MDSSNGNADVHLHLRIITEAYIRIEEELRLASSELQVATSQLQRSEELYKKLSKKHSIYVNQQKKPSLIHNRHSSAMDFHGIMQQLQSQTTGNGNPQVALLKDQLETKDRRIANLEESLEYATAKEKEISNIYIAKLNRIGELVEKLVDDGFQIPTDVLTYLRAHTNTELPPIFMPFDRPTVRTFEGDIALPYQCDDAAKNRDASGGAAHINPARIPLLKPLEEGEVFSGPSAHDEERVTGSGFQRTGGNTEPLGTVHRHINPKGRPSMLPPTRNRSIPMPKPLKRGGNGGLGGGQETGEGAAAHHASPLSDRSITVPRVSMALLAPAAPSDPIGSCGNVKRHGDAINGSPGKRRRTSGVLTPPTREELEEVRDNHSGESASSLGSNASLFEDPAGVDNASADKPTIKGKEGATLGTLSTLNTKPNSGPGSIPNVVAPSLIPDPLQTPDHGFPASRATSNPVSNTSSASIKDRYQDLDSMIQQVQQEMTIKNQQHTPINKHQETVMKQRSPHKRQRSKKQRPSPKKQHTPIKEEHHSPVKEEQRTPSKKHEEAVLNEETLFEKPHFSYADAQGGHRPDGKGLADWY